MPAQPIVVLIGPPAAGKSRVGRKLAKLLEVPFVDTDSRIVQDHGPIAEIFRSRGEPAFRELERDVVSQALRESAVVSLGGGAVLDEQTQNQLSEARVVLLTVTRNAVARRISGAKRPLLAAQSSQERLDAWSALVESRLPLYERLAEASWDTSTRPISAIAREIAEWVSSIEQERTAP